MKKLMRTQADMNAWNEERDWLEGIQLLVSSCGAAVKDRSDPVLHSLSNMQRLIDSVNRHRKTIEELRSKSSKGNK